MKEIKYEEAVHKLEAIVDKMERGELDIDSMAAQLKEAQELVKLCKQKLKRTDNEIQKLLEKQSFSFFLFRKRNVSLINLLFGCMVRIFCLLL